MDIKKVTIIGSGYVGFSLAVMFGSKLQVNIIDIDKSKLDKINKRQPLFRDELITKYLESKKFSFNTYSKIDSEHETDLFILCLPTDFDEEKRAFDTSILEKEIGKIKSIFPDTPILIKSTIPIGFTESQNVKHNSKNIIFSPEFLREGSSLKDSINPSRIIIGDESEIGKDISNLFLKFSLNEPKVIFMTSEEAEAIKLFSNSYLAMRIAFFNEVDSLCLEHDLNPLNVIRGISLDSRIGEGYNNPSFGYGGYCLPKDTKQLEKNFQDVSQNLISSIIDSNSSRKKYLAKKILELDIRKIGVFGISMKKDSDNFRDSSILDLLDILNEFGIEFLIFDENLNVKSLGNYRITKNFDELISFSELIIANRKHPQLENISNTVFTRDIFGES